MRSAWSCSGVGSGCWIVSSSSCCFPIRGRSLIDKSRLREPSFVSWWADRNDDESVRTGEPRRDDGGPGALSWGAWRQSRWAGAMSLWVELWVGLFGFESGEWLKDNGRHLGTRTPLCRVKNSLWGNLLTYKGLVATKSPVGYGSSRYFTLMCPGQASVVSFFRGNCSTQ